MSELSPKSAPSASQEYICQIPLDLYTSPECKGLATQGDRGRHLQIVQQGESALEIRLCEDDYKAWLPISQKQHLQPTGDRYSPPSVSRSEIETRIPAIIAFMRAAMAQPHHYLWGGTIAPHYDCSGLMQAAFAASGIWIPRDSYQQADFTAEIAIAHLIPGDLIFFQETTRVSHVALYLGDGQYIHSSGKQKGRNGIGIDELSPQGGQIARTYYQYLLKAGRVMQSYQPQDSGK